MGDVRNIRSVTGSDIVCLEGNGTRPSHKGDGYRVSGVMYTLNITEVHCVCYSIGAMNSKGWLDGKPDTGCSETDVARSLDASGGNPACWQGGIAVVEIHKS